MTATAVWYLYRLWAVDGRRMYVGITSQDPPQRRIVQHATRAWWPHVDSTRTQLEVLNRGRPITKAEAEAVERREIQADGGTLANNEWNGGRGALFERHLERGGSIYEWEPDQLVGADLGPAEPWSGPAGELALTITVAVGVAAATAAVIATVLHQLVK